MESTGEHLFYRWNNVGNIRYPEVIEINDETLRDGIQAGGIRQPVLKEKLELVTLMEQLGLDAACIGFPAAGPAMMRDLRGIIRHIQENRFSIKIACAARTVEEDIIPIVELSQQFGIPIDANIFVGSSPIRQYVEGWDTDHILGLVENAVGFAIKNDLPVCFITEDTTRSKPGDLERIYRAAAGLEVYRVCLCDTVGYAVPEGTRQLVTFIKSLLQRDHPEILVDWHGHNDRGLGLANALAALEAGVDRVHCTGLGIGERSGNTSMEQLLVNLKLMGLKDFNALKLKEYGMAVSRVCGVPIPMNMPIFGSKAFATATGVHAAAIIKAQKMNDNWLADRVYSSVPAQELGTEQKIEIGPMSGKSNVKYFLEKNNIFDENLVDPIFNETKNKGRSLTGEELSQLVSRFGYTLAGEVAV
ncbi:MAG: 2-isopropylmalate synthase [bacterium]|nr:2-isopropylmalate synthase [bacterium]